MDTIANSWHRAKSVDSARDQCLRERVTHLYLSDATDRDFSSLADFPHLSHLMIANCRYAVDLRCLARASLVELFLMDSPAVYDIDWITGLISLRKLGLWGSVSRVVHGKRGGSIKSLRPCASLTNLQSVRLGGVRIEADGLMPLVGLRSLTDLQFGRKVFPKDEVEAFSSLRPDVAIQT